MPRPHGNCIVFGEDQFKKLHNACDETTKHTTASSSLRTTKTHKATKATISATPSPALNYSVLCEGNQPNRSMWELFDIGSYAVKLSNEMPSNKSSYADYVVSKTPGILRFECTVLEDCQLVVNNLNCSSEEDMLGYSILVSIWNARRFIHGITNSITKAQDNIAFIEPILLNFTNSDIQPTISAWRNTIVSGSLGFTGACLFAARLVFSGEGGVFLSWLNVATGLASGATSIDSGVISSLVTQAVEAVENQFQEEAKMTEYLYTVFNTTYLGYVKWGNNILNGIVEQGGDLVNFSNRENGIVKWIKDGSFTTQISDDWTVNLDAKNTRTATAGAINLEWIEEEIYLVNTTDAYTWGWDNYTESGLNLDKNDMYRVNFGDEIWLAIKHTNGTGPDEAYSPPPGWTILDKLSLTGQDVINASVWSQHKIGFNTTWEPTLAQSYLYSDDSPPGDIFMTIPVCQLAQMPAPASLAGRTCMDVKIADECNLKQYINYSCSKQVQITNGKLQSWPYKMYGVKETTF